MRAHDLPLKALLQATLELLSDAHHGLFHSSSQASLCLVFTPSALPGSALLMDLFQPRLASE